LLLDGRPELSAQLNSTPSVIQGACIASLVIVHEAALALERFDASVLDSCAYESCRAVLWTATSSAPEQSYEAGTLRRFTASTPTDSLADSSDAA
jgi:hypothetical protein